MTKPLLICDCDEVLLHMVKHFGAWLGEAHDIDFAIQGSDLSGSMTRRDGSPPPTREDMWGFFQGFFPGEMHRQTLVPHAREALARLAQRADIVILTNLGDECRTHRIDQLAALDIAHRVECNQGGKGVPVARLVAEFGDPVTVFVDDLATHHASVRDHAPGVHRLHMIAEPSIAGNIPPAPAAHVRIDDWRDASDWIVARFDEGRPATD